MEVGRKRSAALRAPPRGLPLALVLAGTLAIDRPFESAPASTEPASAGRTHPLAPGLELGARAVGYRILLARDPTRTARLAGGVAARPVVVSVWYPAVEGTGAPMRLRDVVAGEGEALRRAGWPDAPADALAEFRPPGGADSARDADRLLGVALRARRDAAFAAGARFLALYAHTDAASKVLPGEYLASHGLVVVSASVAGTYERTLDVGISGAETQARDLEVARSEAERALSWRPEREAILGMSFGGLSELCYAVRHAELAAIVSLDGGAGGPPGAATIRQSPWFDPGRITAALLHLYQPEGADVAFFDALRYAPRGLVRFAGLRHVDFSGAGGFEAVLAPAADRAAGRRARERAEVWRLCRRFLENALAGRASPFAGLALDPAAGEVKLLEPLPAPPQLEELRALARTRGFPAIEEVYRRFAPRDPAPLSEETCRRLGGWLLDNGKGTDARDLFALQVAMYPGSARARYLLGTAEARLGDRDAARRTLSRALELLATDASLDLASRQRIERAAREALGTQ